MSPEKRAFLVALLVLLVAAGGCRQAPANGTSQGPAAPELALLLLVDKSGSANANIASERAAVLAAAEVLDGNDLFGVIAFDTHPTEAWPLSPAKDTHGLKDCLAHIEAHGGTNIYTALEASYRTLQKIGTPRRHVVLVTDGVTPAADLKELSEKMSAEGISLTSICMATGSEFDWLLMSNLAKWGRGRFSPVERPDELPRFVKDEVQYVASRKPLQAR